MEKFSLCVCYLIEMCIELYGGLRDGELIWKGKDIRGNDVYGLIIDDGKRWRWMFG